MPRPTAADNAELKRQLAQRTEEMEEQAKRLEAQEKALTDQGEKIDALLEGISGLKEAVITLQTAPPGQSTDAQHHPVHIRTPVVSAMEEQIGQDGTAHFDRDIGDGREEPNLIEPAAQPVDHPRMAEKIEKLAFDKQILRVRIGTTSDEDADLVFDVAVNGRRHFFVRGEEYDVPRMFVEVLARAKPVGYRNEEYTDHDGVRKVRYPKRTGLRYPFDVLHDPDPRGAAWLKGILAEAA